MGQKQVKKAFFQKLSWTAHRCSNECFQPMSSLFLTRFGPWKIPKCLDNGPKMGQTWVKSRSKIGFPKVVPDRSAVLKRVFSAHVEPVSFGPWKIQKFFESGPFLFEEWAKKGSKKHFPKCTLELLGCATQFFQPILSPYYTFGPQKISTSFENGPFLVEKWAEKG